MFESGLLILVRDDRWPDFVDVFVFGVGRAGAEVLPAQVFGLAPSLALQEFKLCFEGALAADRIVILLNLLFKLLLLLRTHFIARL